MLQESQGRRNVAFALRTGGPLQFSITRFPLLPRAPVAGLALPGRQGRGQVLPEDLWVSGDVSRQPCPSPGFTFLHSGVCWAPSSSVQTEHSHDQTLLEGHGIPHVWAHSHAPSPFADKIRRIYLTARCERHSSSCTSSNRPGSSLGRAPKEAPSGFPSNSFF